MAVNFIWPDFLYCFRVRICENKPCLPVFRISPFSARYILAVFPCTVCYPLTIGVLKSLVERGRSPLEPAKEHPSTPPLSLQQYSHERSGNWETLFIQALRCFSLLPLILLDIRLRFHRGHQFLWKPALHLRRPSSGPDASRAELRRAQARV